MTKWNRLIETGVNYYLPDTLEREIYRLSPLLGAGGYLVNIADRRETIWPAASAINEEFWAAQVDAFREEATQSPQTYNWVAHGIATRNLVIYIHATNRLLSRMDNAIQAAGRTERAIRCCPRRS